MLYEYQNFKQWQKRKCYIESSKKVVLWEILCEYVIAVYLACYRIFRTFQQKCTYHKIFPDKLAFLMAILIILIFLVNQDAIYDDCA